MPLVGRDTELAELHARLRQCAEGRGGVVLLAGESGAGKTRLVTRAALEWDGRLLRGRALRGAPAFATFGRVWPELATDGPRAADLVLKALVAEARRGPALLHLEDCHDADAATLELLAVADETLLDASLLVVAEYRSDQLPRRHPVRALRAELRRRHGSAGTTLGPLTGEQTRALVEAVLQGPAEPALAERVHHRSEGNPFFAEELLRGLVEGDALTLRAGSWGLGSDPVEAPLPESVVDAVLARTARVRESWPEAVDYAAVMGTQVDLRALERLAGGTAVDALLAEGLLHEVDERFAAFRHGLVREALLHVASWSLRRRLHREVAEVLESAGAPPALVAEHWAGAQQPQRARSLLLQALEQHCAAHALRDAAAAAGRALELWPTSEDPAGRVRTQERLAECAEAHGDFELALDTWRAVAAAPRIGGLTADVARAHRGAANAAEMLGRVDLALHHRLLSAETFESVGVLGSAAEERLALAQRLKAAGLLTRAREESEVAGRLAAAAAHTTVKVVANALEGASRSALGDRTAGVQLARAAVAEALAADLAEVSAEAVYELAGALEYAADYSAAAEAYDHAVELCTTHGLVELGPVCFVCTSPVARLMGEWDRVLEVCARVREDDRAQLFVRRVADEEAGLVAALRGDVRRARGGLRRAADFGQAHAVFGIEIGAVWGLALVADLEGDRLGCRQLVDRMLLLCDSSDECHYALPALRWAASWLASAGTAEDVAVVHRTAARRSRANTAPRLLSTVAHCGGELAGVEGDVDRAATMIARSLDLLEGIRAPYELALSGWRLGRTESVRGQRAAAVRHLTMGHHTARVLGARPLARACAEELDRLGEPVARRLGRRAARELAGHGLTPRELEVLQHLARDQTNREIARRLFLSVRTVDMHVRHILEKLGCSTRVAAVREATRLDLVVPDHGNRVPEAR